MTYFVKDQSVEFFYFSQLSWNALSTAVRDLRNFKRLHLHHVHVKDELWNPSIVDRATSTSI
jgi:hypothetical protein